MKEYRVIVRTNNDGSQQLCDFDSAAQDIRQHHKPADGILRRLASGHVVHCVSTTYQHRDFVEG